MPVAVSFYLTAVFFYSAPEYCISFIIIKNLVVFLKVIYFIKWRRKISIPESYPLNVIGNIQFQCMKHAFLNSCCFSAVFGNIENKHVFISGAPPAGAGGSLN